MIRSAKMNAIASPKLMPPFQRTAASGIFPTEHTNEITATNGPTIGLDLLNGSKCEGSGRTLVPSSRSFGGHKRERVAEADACPKPLRFGPSQQTMADKRARILAVPHLGIVCLQWAAPRTA